MTGLSEFAAVPSRIVVHDPAAAGALDADELPLYRERPDPAGFSAQHRALADAIAESDVEVVELREIVDPPPNPNQVYTRDSVITLPWLPGAFVRGAMRKEPRHGEPHVMSQALERLGLRELFAAATPLEGGDLIPFGERALLVGYGPRTARESLDLLWERLDLDELIGIELDPERMNLDGVLVPVADDTFVVHRESIVSSFVRSGDGDRPVDVVEWLQGAGLEPADVTREESLRLQACNCLCLGERRIVCYDLAPRVLEELRTRGLDVTAIPASELIKGTGGPRCMTRPIY